MSYLKIEIISDKQLLDIVTGKMHELGFTGYSLLDISSGKGKILGKSIADGITGANRFCLLISIVEEIKIKKLMEFLEDFFSDHLGVYWTTKVEHFSRQKSAKIL